MTKLNRKFITGLVFSLVLVSYPLATASSSADSLVVTVGDRLFAAQNYSAALTEYQRALFLNPRSPYLPYLWFQLSRCYKALGNYMTSADYLKKTLHLPLSQPVRQKLRFQLALAYLLAQKTALANLEFFKLENQVRDSSRALAFRAFRLFTLILQHQWQPALQEAQKLQSYLPPDARLVLQRIIFRLDELAHHPRLKSPTVAHRLSTVLPGAGQIYAGDWRNGLNALFLNAGTVYLLWQSVTIGSWLDLVLIGSFVWWRYYEGNRIRTRLIVQQNNEDYLREMTRALLEDLQQLGQFLPAISLDISKEELILR